MRKCVIFDLDGTLTRSEEGIWNCVRYAAEKLGFPVPDAATLRKFIGPPLGWSFMEYMGMSEEMANKAVNTYRERYEAVGLFENRVYPGIRRLLRMLHRDGWYIGIATGKPQRSSERIIEHFGLNRYITKIVGPKDGHGADKELLIRQALPEDAGEAWMVGDRRFDMEGAKKVGIGAIGAGYGYGRRADEQRVRCVLRDSGGHHPPSLPRRRSGSGRVSVNRRHGRQRQNDADGGNGGCARPLGLRGHPQP